MSDDRSPQREQIAKRLREARIMAGLSQGQVAKLLGFHRPTISEAEAGNRKVSAEELAAFAKLYDVDTSWLLGVSSDSISFDDPRVQLAARELGKLNADDLERMLRLLAAIKGESG